MSFRVMLKRNGLAKILLLQCLGLFIAASSYAQCDPGWFYYSYNLGGAPHESCIKALSSGERAIFSTLGRYATCSWAENKWAGLVNNQNVWRVKFVDHGKQKEKGGQTFPFDISNQSYFRYGVTPAAGRPLFTIQDSTVTRIYNALFLSPPDMEILTWMGKYIQHESAHVMWASSEEHDYFKYYLDYYADGNPNSQVTPRWSSVCPKKIMHAGHEAVATYFGNLVTSGKTCMSEEPIYDTDPAHILDLSGGFNPGDFKNPSSGLSAEVMEEFLQQFIGRHCRGVLSHLKGGGAGWGCAPSVCKQFGWDSDTFFGIRLDVLNPCGRTYTDQDRDGHSDQVPAGWKC